jgi:hypothetical protein
VSVKREISGVASTRSYARKNMADQEQVQHEPLPNEGSFTSEAQSNITTTTTKPPHKFEIQTQLNPTTSDKQAEGSTSPSSDILNQRALGERPETLYDASYTAHTHASKAKHADKVELAPSRVVFHAGLKEPPTGIDAALGDRDNAADLRRQKRDAYGTSQVSRESHEGMPLGGSPRAPDVSSYTYNRSPSEKTLCGETPESVLTLRIPDIDDLDSDTGTLVESVDALGENLLDNHWDVKTDVEVHEEVGDDAKSIPSTEIANVRFLQARVRALRKENAQLKQDVQTKSDAEADAVKNAQVSNENMQRLRSDVKKMATTLRQSSLTDSYKTFRARTPKTPRTPTSINPGVYLDPDAGKLYSAVCQLTQQFETTLQSLSARNAHLQTNLAEKEKDLSIVITALEASKSTSAPVPLQPSHEDWESFYKTERAQKEACERRIALLKRLAAETYRPGLKKENRDLRIEQQQLVDKVSLLHDKATSAAVRAAHWEHECKLTATRAEKDVAGLQHAVDAQADEMRAHIKAYRDKTHDPAHWAVAALQAHVAALEHAGLATQGLLRVASSAKARLEDEVRRLMDAYKALEDENTRLGALWVLGGSAPMLPGRRMSSAVAPGGGEKGILVHPYFHPHMVAAREAKVQEFRNERAVRRREDAALAQVMEKVREWRMGKEGRKLTGREAYEKRAAWNLWGGEAWLAEGASAEEKEAVKELREKGVLPGLEKRG